MNSSFSCKSCDKKYKQFKGLKLHIKAIHEKLKEFSCMSCGKSFTQSHSLRRHTKIVHEGLKLHKCHSCGSSFTQSYSLKLHQKSVHKDLKIEAKSENVINIKLQNQTEKTADSTNLFETETEVDNDINFRQFENESKSDPERKDATKIEYSNDIAKAGVHEGENKESKSGVHKETELENGTKEENKMMKCDICEKSFGKLIELQKHITKFHKKTKIPNKNAANNGNKLLLEFVAIVCQSCGKKFTQINHLSNHIKSVHKELKFENGIKKQESVFKNKLMKCEFCDKTFDQLVELEKHNEYHYKKAKNEIPESSMDHIEDAISELRQKFRKNPAVSFKNSCEEIVQEEPKSKKQKFIDSSNSVDCSSKDSNNIENEKTERKLSYSLFKASD